MQVTHATKAKHRILMHVAKWIQYLSVPKRMEVSCHGLQQIPGLLERHVTVVTTKKLICVAKVLLVHHRQVLHHAFAHQSKNSSSFFLASIKTFILLIFVPELTSSLFFFDFNFFFSSILVRLKFVKLKENLIVP